VDSARRFTHWRGRPAEDCDIQGRPAPTRLRGGHSIIIEVAVSRGQSERLAGLATDLVQLKVTIIVATGLETIRAAPTRDQDHPDRNGARRRSGRQRLIRAPVSTV